MKDKKDDDSFSISSRLPIGFGLSLAADERAMAAFSGMSLAEKERTIEESKNQHSKKDMSNFVHRLGQDQMN